jgi:hypothetical protein
LSREKRAFYLQINEKGGIMKSKILGVLAVCFILGLLPLAVNGQAPEKQYQLFLVVDELVKPSMMDAYYEAGKKWTAYMKAHEYPYPFNTFWTGDNHVYWSFPIQSYADIDKMMEESKKLREKSPDEYKALEDAFKGTYDTSRICVYTLDYENSMIAEGGEGEPEESNFIFFDIYYFEPVYDNEMNKLWDEWKAFLSDKEIVQTWEFYWGAMGTDNPMIVMAASAKNAVEFEQENAKMWNVLGNEASQIKQKMMKYVRKQEQKTAWFQKELSYTSVKSEKMKDSDGDW